MNHIKDIRTARRFTQIDLSNKSGVHKNTLSQWETGKRIPRDVYALYRIAQVLECHIEDLIDPADADA